MSERRPRHEIRHFAPEFADDAARLLVDRHRAQRLVEPAPVAGPDHVAATRAPLEAHA